jgi:multidrug efflux pump subunit AcrA (membrane-fusion protein)
MELAGQVSYRQLAEEIGEVLQAAAETAEKMLEEARADAARIRGEAEAELRNAYTEGRRILDEARMEADMLRAEAEWQSQEILAQARRQVAERMAGADTRLANIEQAESRVLDRLAGVGQLVADTLATLREGQREAAAIAEVEIPEIQVPEIPDVADDGADEPSAKVYFVEFPPPAPPAPMPQRAESYPAPQPEPEIMLTENPDASLFNSDRERSEWAPPPDMPTWWTRGGAQG